MRLTESIHNKAGYNVTTDNFFTSVHVASLLQQKKDYNRWDGTKQQQGPDKRNDKMWK